MPEHQQYPELHRNITELNSPGITGVLEVIKIPQLFASGGTHHSTISTQPSDGEDGKDSKLCPLVSLQSPVMGLDVGLILDVVG